MRQAQQEIKQQVSTITTMPVKDYHRLVRANYVAVEGPRVSRPSRFQTYLPFLLLLALLVGAAVAFGHF